MSRFLILAWFCLGASLLPAQELRDYERKVTEFSLANGLHFILLERHQAPVVSFHTYIDAGSSQDPAGLSGLANLLARLAFDGTETIGSKDWPAEKKALDDVELTYDRVDAERGKGAGASAGTLAVLKTGANIALNSAEEQENPDEFRRAFQENGAVHVASVAKPDSLETSYSLPSNRIELWFLLESQRLTHPVFRDFYREREKAMAESATVAAGHSSSRLAQALLSTAFEILPYRHPQTGWPNDLESLRVADLKSYWETYAGPGNIVISMVGDVDPANARALAERYFGPMNARPHPPLAHQQEPPQQGPKTVAVWGDGQPKLLVGYKRPGETNRDDAALDFIQMILGDPHTGWMHQDLVEDKRIAEQAEAIASFPSGRYLNLFVLAVTPARDHTIDENRKALDDLVKRLTSQPVDEETLTRLKNLMRGRLARALARNDQLAAVLAAFYVRYGDWRKLFALGPQYDQMTAAELQRVAALYFSPAGRTTAYLANGEQIGGQQ